MSLLLNLKMMRAWIPHYRVLKAGLFALLLAGGTVFSQTRHPIGSLVLNDTTEISGTEFARLQQEFGKNKIIPAGYEKIILFTLSHFPELKKHHITFQIRDHGAPLSSRPEFGSLFRSATHRTYMVFINGAKNGAFGGFDFNKVPIAGQIGILGHELSHVVNFSKSTSFDLLELGAKHMSKSYMDRFEFYTDSLCIEHGLGYYLLAWSNHWEEKFGTDNAGFNNNSTSTPTGERYMSSATIRKYIQKSRLYGTNDQESNLN